MFLYIASVCLLIKHLQINYILATRMELTAVYLPVWKSNQLYSVQLICYQLCNLCLITTNIYINWIADACRPVSADEKVNWTNVNPTDPNTPSPNLAHHADITYISVPDCHLCPHSVVLNHLRCKQTADFGEEPQVPACQCRGQSSKVKVYK